MILPIVCCVGTTEPWNVAGLGLDYRALAGCEARAVTVVVGVSAQDGRGIHRALPISPELIAAQFDALERAPIAAIRIGALLDAPAVVSVANELRARRRNGRGVPVVFDPVLSTSAGGELASAETIESIARELLPLVTIVTPNIAEAHRLAAFELSRGRGHEGETFAGNPTPDSMAERARALVAMGASGAFVTGGHLAGDPIDVFVDAGGETRYRAPRIAGGELRGTGCLLACALAAELARGASSRDAIPIARAFVRERFATSVELGGMRAAY